VNVEVTVELPPMKPPYNESKFVVKAPLSVTVWSVDVPAEITGQCTPLSRQTWLPATSNEPTLNEEPEAFAKPNQAVDVPFTNTSVSTVPFVAYKFVLVVFVPVAFVHEIFVKEDGVVPVMVTLLNVAVVALRVSETRFVNVPFVPKRFVVVTDVAVTLAKFAFQRSDAVPSEKIASPLGVRFDPTKPSKPKLVDVTFEAVAFANVTLARLVAPNTVNVEVTVELEPMKPPYSWRVVVAKAPRAETVASVSTSPGQFVPFWRQICWPATYNCVVETTVANRLVVVTSVNVAFVAVSV
jgi:hypothetical protein